MRSLVHTLKLLGTFISVRLKSYEKGTHKAHVQHIFGTNSQRPPSERGCGSVGWGWPNFWGEVHTWMKGEHCHGLCQQHLAGLSSPPFTEELMCQKEGLCCSNSKLVTHSNAPLSLSLVWEFERPGVLGYLTPNVLCDHNMVVINLLRLFWHQFRWFPDCRNYFFCSCLGLLCLVMWMMLIQEG